MSEQFSNPEQALIERLRRAPQPELSADARNMIRARMLDALDHPPVPAPRPTLLRPAVVIVVVFVTAALIAGGVLLVLSQQKQTVTVNENNLQAGKYLMVSHCTGCHALRYHSDYSKEKWNEVLPVMFK